MSKRQIDCCTDRLRQVSQRDANMFDQMQAEAALMIKKAVAMRKEAWEIYHQHFEPRKR